MTRSLALALAIAALALAAAPAAAQTKIQPGAEMSTDAGGCTMNFIYDGLGANAGKVYFGTAAHCVEKVGVMVQDGEGTVVGRTAAVGSPDDAATDWAFVEVLPEHLGRVDPAMKGHPTYPTGVVTPDETAAGDEIQASGYGIGFSATQPTQEQRRSILQSQDAELFTLSGPNVNGDSGGPFVHIDTGKALGVVSQYGFFQAATDVGPTVQGILDKATKAGFPVSMRAAGQPAPAAPAPQQQGQQQQQPQSTPPQQQPQGRGQGDSRSDDKPKGKAKGKKKSKKAACPKSAKRKGNSRGGRKVRRRCSKYRRSARSRSRSQRG